MFQIIKTIPQYKSNQSDREGILTFVKLVKEYYVKIIPGAEAVCKLDMILSRKTQ